VILELQDQNIDLQTAELQKPVGCEKCSNTGYRGRTGVHELLKASPKMKKLVAARSEVPVIRDTAIEEGMRTIVQDGVNKIFLGQTDLTQLRRITSSD